MLILKHLYQWSYQETEARVKDSLVLRWFCRVGFHRLPDASTLWRWEQTLRPETLHALNDRVVQLARQARVTQGRKLRLDATCVETEIHHPTDSGLLVDSVRVRLPLRQTRQRAGLPASTLAGADLSLAAALSQTGGTTVASAVATQRGRQRGRAETAVPSAGGDHPADGTAGEPGGGGTGPADRAAGHATAHPGRGDPPSGKTGDRANAQPGPRGKKSSLRTESAQPL